MSDCPHGEESWYCDACAFAREKQAVVDRDQVAALTARLEDAERRLGEARRLLTRSRPYLFDGNHALLLEARAWLDGEP